MPSTKQRRRSKRHAERLVEEAIDAAETGELHLAEKLIQRALSAGPMNARFWLEYARLAKQRGQNRRAERAVRRALELSPAYVEAKELQQELVPPRESAPPQPELDGADEVPVFSERSSRFDWSEIETELTTRGLVRIPRLLQPEECIALRSRFHDDACFEHDVRLDDHRGRVAYRFFRRPLPALVLELREEIYARLAPIANRWNELIRDPARWPATHRAFERVYRAAGQGRTSPILLHYEAGGSNGFHRDVYGSIFFPLQMAVTLGPATAADGGELALVDDRPGRRKRIRAIATEIGDAIIFCTRDRLCPIAGLYGRQPVMHGVQEVRAERYALGVPFCDYQG